MIHALHQTVAPALFERILPAFNTAVLERLTLLLNHVVASEPEATARLKPHAGAALRLSWLPGPAWLPQPPGAAWRVTPAGLFELIGDEEPPVEALQMTLDAWALADWGLAGAVGAPPMDVQGDAGFATTLAWLSQHLRWDIEDDLARVVGDTPARLLGQMGRRFAALLRSVVGRGAGRV